MEELNTGVYRCIIDHDADAIIISDAAGAIIEVNPAACTFFGYSREHFLKLHYNDIVQQERQSVESQVSASMPTMVYLKAGSQPLLSAPVISCYTDPLGHYLKCTRIQLQQHSSALAAIGDNSIINNTEDFIWTVSREFTLVTANTAFIENMHLTGNTIRPGDNLLMKSVFETGYPAYWQQLYERALNGESFKAEIFAPAQNKRLASWFEVSFNPIYSKLGVAGIACQSRNITEKKRAEEIIHNSEEKRRLIMNAALDAIICIDTRGLVTFWNPQASNIFGWTSEEVNGQLLSDYIIPAPYRKMHDEGMKNYLATGEGPALNVLLELEAANKMGQKFPIELTVLPIKQGEEVFFCAFIRNIAGRKKTENELKESIERYNLAVKATHDAIWDWNPATGMVHWGEGYKNFFGHADGNADHYKTNTWPDHIHPAEQERVMSGFNSLVGGKENAWTDEYRYLKADGSYAYVRDRGFIMRDKNGKATRMVGAMHDITKRKKEEEHLRLLESVIAGTTDAVTITEKGPGHGLGHRIIYVNNAFLKMTGYTREEVVGRTRWILHGPGPGGTELAKINQAIIEGVACTGTILNYKKSGEPFWVNLSVSPVTDPQGQYKHWIAIERDVTAEKKAEALLTLSNERYHIVANTTNDSIWDWDLLSNTVERQGKKLEQLLGHPAIAPEKVDEFWRTHVHPLDWEQMTRKRNLLFHNPAEHYWQDEYRLLKPDGLYANILDKGYILRDQEGKAIRMIGASRDITAERQAKEILELSEARYRYLFDNNPACILIWHLDDFTIAEINEATLHQYGYTREELLSKTVFDLRKPGEYPLIKSFAETALKDDKFMTTVTWNHIDKFGHELAMQVSSHRISYRNRPSILALAVNVTEKLLMETILQKEKIKKEKEITEAVITAQEKEREQIGTELHDNVAQILVSSRLYLGLAKQDLTYIAETDKLIADAIEEIRALSHRLIPPSFHGQALREAISNLIKIYSLGAGLEVEQVISLPEKGFLSGSLNLAIYRIVQEQFNNISKHANANRVCLSLVVENQHVSLRIKDNGKGFDPLDKTGGVGLLNINTRASLFNGRVEIMSAPGKGCELIVCFGEPK